MCPPSSCYKSQITTKKRKSFNKADETKQKIWLLLDGKISIMMKAEPHGPVEKWDKQMETIIFNII